MKPWYREKRPPSDLFPALEVVRCEGDLRGLGGSGLPEIEVLCPDGVVLFRLKGDVLPPASPG